MLSDFITGAIVPLIGAGVIIYGLYELAGWWERKKYGPVDYRSIRDDLVRRELRKMRDESQKKKLEYAAWRQEYEAKYGPIGGGNDGDKRSDTRRGDHNDTK